MGPRAAWRLESLGFEQVYCYRAGKMDWLAFNLPGDGTQGPMAHEVLRTDAPTCGLADTAADVRARMAEGWSQCLVVNDRSIVLGRVLRTRLDGDPGRRVEEIMEDGPSTYRPSIPLEELIDAMKKREFETAVITDSDGRFLGLVSRQDAEEAVREPAAAAHAR